MTVYIVGAGPAGLGLVDGLSRCPGIQYAVFEKGSDIGGMAATCTWGGHGLHDLGPHKIFSLNRELMAGIKALLPEDQWLVRQKTSRIYMRGHFLSYPPSPFSLSGVYGWSTFFHMMKDYALSRAKHIFGPGIPPESFAQDLESRLGNSLYRALFQPIAEKLWDDPALLDAKLSKGRVQTPSLMELLSKALGLAKRSEFEALEFLYPKGGLGKIWTAIREKNRERGRILLNRRVSKIVLRGKAVVELHHEDVATGEETRQPVGDADFLFSTMPLPDLAKALCDTDRGRIIGEVESYVCLNDLILVFLKIREDQLLDVSWIFIPDKGIPFHRISEQRAFDPSMTPNGSIVCCEIMSRKDRNHMGMDDGQLRDLCLKGIRDMGLKGIEVEAFKVVRIPASYPVMKRGYADRLDALLAELDGLDNFRTIGRQGAYNYIGTLDAMDIGYGAARWLGRCLEEKNFSGWEEERRRTTYYPVLD